MFIDDMRHYVIRPALTLTGLWSPSAENLLCGTLLTESGGVALKQFKGPALGLYQTEPQTHDTIKSSLCQPDDVILLRRVLDACSMRNLPNHDALVWNLRYATIVARLVYRLTLEPLPDAEDAKALAEYHKQYYNTAKGKADPKKTVKLFEGVIQRAT